MESLARRVGGVTAAALALLVMTVVTASGALAPARAVAQPAAAAPAPEPAWLRYSVRRTVSHGTGEYEGYHDSLVASGRYQTERPEPDRLIVSAHYFWRYAGPRCEHGEERRVVPVALPSRLYTGRTDLDDYDEHAGPLALWLWIPPDLEVGATVPILERTFTVEGREPLPGGHAQAIRVQAQGEGTRDDDYGQFRTRFTDTYWFDAATGYFLRSEYQELDESAQASFEWNERVSVDAASYLGGVDAGPMEVAGCPEVEAPYETRRSRAARTLVMVLPFAALALLVGYLVFRSRGGGPRFTARRVGSESELPPARTGGALAPFVPHLARVALRTGDPVAIVQPTEGAALGVAIGDTAQRFAFVEAKDGDVCEALRTELRVEDVLSETFHEELPSVGAAARAAGVKEARAYNLVATREVLQLAPVPALAFDVARVQAIRADDREAVAAFLTSLQALPAGAWLDAILAEGDHGFCARGESGAVVGVAFVTLAGDRARLHSLLVAPDARGAGLGSELARACVSTASALGARSLVAEVSPDEVGARALLEALGFAKAGELFHMTASATRADRRIVRR